MLLPFELREIIESAIEAVNQSIEGELLLCYRRRIWIAMGPYQLNADKCPIGLGYLRRTRLSILTVRHVLDLLLPGEKRPQEIIEISEQLIKQTLDRYTVQKQQEGRWSDFEDLLGEHPVSSYIGRASVCCVGTVLNDENTNYEDLSETDYSFDPYGWDESFWASLAYAGGGLGEEGSSAQRRRTFWQWYVQKAVPLAFLSVANNY